MGKKHESDSPLDEEELIASLSDFELEETTFEQWKKLHDDLNITVFAQVSTSQIEQEETITVRYCKTTREYDGKVLQKLHKEKKEITLKLSDKTSDRTQITYSGEGDQDGDSHGDLQVIVVLKE